MRMLGFEILCDAAEVKLKVEIRYKANNAINTILDENLDKIPIEFSIDLVDLPYFLHELTPISHDTLQTIIFDIIEDNEGKELTLPELRRQIFNDKLIIHHHIIEDIKKI